MTSFNASSIVGNRTNRYNVPTEVDWRSMGAVTAVKDSVSYYFFFLALNFADKVLIECL